jgi:catalase
MEGKIGEEMRPLGFKDAHQAVKDAVEKGHEADPY